MEINESLVGGSGRTKLRYDWRNHRWVNTAFWSHMYNEAFARYKEHMKVQDILYNNDMRPFQSRDGKFD